MTMPDQRNSGYWTDNNLKPEDFKTIFEIEKIENNIFDELWKNFEKEKKTTNKDM